MSLSPADLAAVETWAGPTATEDEDDLDARLARLGSPYAVALELLLRDRAEFARSPETVASGQDRVSTGKNVDWLNAQIGALVRFVRGSDAISPSEAFEVLLGAVEAGAADYTEVISVVADGSRRA